VTAPNNETAVCIGALRFLAGRRREPIRIVEEPDRVERQQQAVEMVAASDTARFVLEHTRIESFDGQIADGKRLNDLLGQLETVLPPFLQTGSYDIIIEPHAARAIRAVNLDSVRFAIAKWIVVKAQDLKAGPDGDFADTDVVDERPWSVTEKPPDVPFDVTLQCVPRDEGVVVFAMRFKPPNIEESRRSRIRTALTRKCPKLARAKQQHDALSVLLLESDDIALANRHVISEAVVLELKDRPDRPDFVFLVETDRGLAWQLWIVKDETREYPAIEASGPFGIDPPSV
jgi:hypothetical protein